MVTATISASGLVHFMVLPPKVELRSTVASTGEWVKPPSRASHPPDHTNGNADPMPNAGIMPACSSKPVRSKHIRVRFAPSAGVTCWNSVGDFPQLRDLAQRGE